MPRVRVVFPAALSPAMASIVGRGPRARSIRISFSGTRLSLPGDYVRVPGQVARQRGSGPPYGEVTYRPRASPPPGGGEERGIHKSEEGTYASDMSRSPPRLVIVDDHQMVLDGLRAMLAAYQSSVQIVGEACEPGDVIALVTEAEPDIVLLDVRLHGTSGLDLCAAILRRRPG